MKAIYQKPAVVVVQLQSSFSLLTESEGNRISASATQSGYEKDDDNTYGFSQNQ